MYIALQCIEKIKVSILLNKERNYRREKCCIEINLKSVDATLGLHKSSFPWAELMSLLFDCKNVGGTKAF